LQRVTSPESVGISSERLQDLSAAFQAGVDKKEIPGAVVLIARHGKVVYFDAFGYRDRESAAPMGLDSIFRIGSMTKPVTSIAAMMLVEEGKLNLSVPVSQYLPEFKGVKVGVETRDVSGKTVLTMQAADREMTVLDLMRHTSGITYDFTGKSLVRDQYNKEQIRLAKSNAEFVSRLARAPLQNQPGSVWDYSFSTDVLGRIVEVVSGMELEQFFSLRIFKPLGMTDTAFWFSDPSQQRRIAEVQVDPATGKRTPMPDITRNESWQSGGAGLASTASDYKRFCQMLLNGGELDGTRLISRKTVEQMTKNQLPQGIKIIHFPNPNLDVRPEAGNGFGLGFMVRTANGLSTIPGNVGDFSWPGIFGTSFFVDPKKDLIAIMMIQVPATAAATRTKYWTELRNLVYRTLTD
jgi:CubicO group peptidase (beta-lactamase class C family)